MNDDKKKRPVFRKKERKKTDLQKAEEQFETDEKDEPLQLDFDFGFGEFFDSSDLDDPK